jgi:preprotein translocase subunit SecD
MDRKTKWKTFWLALLTVGAICVLVPSFIPSENLPLWFSKAFNRKVQLGLDLQGGEHIVYSIDLGKAVEDKATEIKRDLEAKLDEQGIAARVTTPRVPVGGVNIILEDPAARERIDGQFLSDYDEVVTRRQCPDELAATSVCIRVSSDYGDRIKTAALDQAIKTIRDRIDERGVAEPTVISKGDQIIVELPGLDEATIDRVKDIIARTAKLEFKIVADGSDYMKRLFAHVENDPIARELGIEGNVDLWVHDESGREYNDWYLQASDRNEFIPIEEAKEQGCWNRNKAEIAGEVECKVSGRIVIERYLEELAEKDPEFVIGDEFQVGYEFAQPAEGETGDSYWRTYYLHRAVELAGSAVSDAYVYWNQTTNRPEVLIDFNRFGGRRFGDLTSQNVGEKMAIILDNRVASAPTIQGAIRGGRSTITMGGGSNDRAYGEAQDLVSVLKTGSLPAPLQEESSSFVGPLLGADAIQKAQLSFMLGAGLVLLIMGYIYRFSGIISVAALALNILTMMAGLALLGATLTLPGIAALVLTVGMAVDANIIIYERIREELRAGKSVRGAVDAGFNHGFSAILDGQLTTAVAAWVLLQYGSGPIRGFAVMLLIGIACTLFSALWVSRLFFEYYVGRGRKAARISI